METVVLNSNSKESLSLLVKLAKKLGINVSVIPEEAAEDLGLLNAIKKGRTGQNVDTNKFLQDLRK